MKQNIEKICRLLVFTAACFLLKSSAVQASEMPPATPVAADAGVVQALEASGPALVTDYDDVSINCSSKTIGTGETFRLRLDNAGDGAVIKWTSSNEDVVIVGRDGKIHGISGGKSIVRAVYEGRKYTCKVKVTDEGLAYAQYELQKGETLRLHVRGIAGKVKWSSGNRNVAKIVKKMDGHVCIKGIKNGTSTILAKKGKKTFACKIRVVKKDKSVIYLTFDDGPSLTSTPKILDILKKNKVNATFFVINYDKKGEKLIKRAASEGNAIAIHGYSHDYAAIYRSKETYISNVTKLQDKLEKTLGCRVWTTRFPGGSSNLVSRRYNRGIMSRLVKEVDKLGYSYFDWNVSSGDAGGSTNSAQVYKSVTRGLRKNRDNVVLMHDFSNNDKTVNALDSIIKYGKSHGYEFKVISDSTTAVHHGVQN
ncbi:MAG: polysaccharide deacetylase family protein [Lachnospiraceae bacterium]|nr:polysaccharide deacetylase family protein [Lachnospiraceae bacterium]